MAMGTLVTRLHELSSDYRLKSDTLSEINILLVEFGTNMMRVLGSLDQLDKQDELWAREMVKLSYNIQDIFDNLDHRLRMAASRGGLIGRVKLKFTAHKASRKIAQQIRNALNIVVEADKRHQRYCIDSTLVNSCGRQLAGGSIELGDEAAKMVEIAAEARSSLHELVAEGQQQGDHDTCNLLPDCLKESIRVLHGEVEGMHAALSVIAAGRPVDEGTRAWAQDMKDVCCSINYKVDKFRKRVELGARFLSTKSGLKRLIAGRKRRTVNGDARREFAAGIIDLKKSVLEVAERRQRYFHGIQPPWRNSVHDDALPTNDDAKAEQHPVVPDLQQDGKSKEIPPLGIEGPMAALLTRLGLQDGDEASTSYSEPQLKVKVVSIVGTVGVGKTTLAKAVYQSLPPGRFDCTAWVSLSINPDIRMVLIDLLGQIMSTQDQQYDNFDWMGETELIINKIWKSLHNKRYYCFLFLLSFQNFKHTHISITPSVLNYKLYIFLHDL